MFPIQSSKHIQPPDEFLREIDRTAIKIRNAVLDIRRLLDWAELQPEIDEKRIGVVGFSLGSVLAVIAMGVDPRISAGVFALGGGDLHKVFARSDARFVQVPREKILKTLGWNQKILEEKLREPFAPLNPTRYALSIDPQRVLVFDAAYDDYIPHETQYILWEALGRPKRITFHYRHKISFLAMTFLGLNYFDRTLVEFLREKL